MIFLLSSIVCSVLIVLIFKYFPRYEVQTFPAIVVNYGVCLAVGSAMGGEHPIKAETLELSWLPWAGFLGILFITGFYSIGVTVQRFGLAIASVMQKMSLVFSVPFAFWFFNESATSLKIAGLAMALGAVLFTNWPERTGNKSGTVGLWWLFPLYVFINAGAIECVLQYGQGALIKPGEEALFATLPFGIAGVIGFAITLVLMAMRKLNMGLREVLAGIVLGIPNYFSIYFLIKAMGSLDKSVVIPSANITVLGISAILGWLLFQERLTRNKQIGLGLALLAIVAISL